MASITGPMEVLSLDERTSTTPLQDSDQPPAVKSDSDTVDTIESDTRTKPRRRSRPDQADPLPLPPMDEWREVTEANGTMYFGFYADGDVLQRVLTSWRPKLRPGRGREFHGAFMYPVLLWLRSRYGSEIGLHVAAVPQRAKDLNPGMIEEDVGENVLVFGLFALEEESYLGRMTQKEVDEIAEMTGMKPTWWRITHLMPSI